MFCSLRPAFRCQVENRGRGKGTAEVLLQKLKRICLDIPWCVFINELRWGHLFLTSHRIGSTSVCSVGAVALGVGQAHGLARYPGVGILAVLHLRRSQMTRTQGITTTFSAFCAQTMGVSLPIVWGHEASMVLTQTCRSSGCLWFKGNRPAGLCGHRGRRLKVAYTDGSGGQAYLIASRWNGSVH